nr:MAG TPA: hypothetical protein [Inoviridae sp.]
MPLLRLRLSAWILFLRTLRFPRTMDLLERLILRISILLSALSLPRLLSLPLSVWLYVSSAKFSVFAPTLPCVREVGFFE